jgi:hypothetical protein
VRLKSSLAFFLFHAATGGVLKRALISLTLASGLGVSALAQVYYVAPAGSDAGPGTAGQPWATFGKAWTVLAPGDTLIAKDGVYAQALAPAVSGAAGSPITIKAENDGKAVIDGGGTRYGISVNGRSHLVIEGFRVQNPGERPAVEIVSPDGTPVSNQANNIVVRRTGARGGAMSSNNHVWTVARVRDVLLEDVWGWGNGRYVMNVYGGTRVTVRRAVLRWDAWGVGASKPGDPKFGMGVYNTHDSLFENVLLIDAASTSLGGDKGGLYVPGNSNGPTAPYTDSDDNRFLGLIALNNAGHGVAVEGGTGGSNDNNVFENLVSWKNTGHGFTVPRNAANTQFRHVTLGANYRGAYSGVGSTSLTDSLVTGNSNIGLNGFYSTSHNNVHGNATDYAGGAAPGASPMSADPQLRYVARLEAGAPGDGAASDGGDRGATVFKRTVDGAVTSADLWPWPNQDRIKAEMCEGVSRGFCGAAVSLTQYVWQFLGHPVPPEIAAGGSAGGLNTPPVAENASIRTFEDVGHRFYLPASDADGDALEFILVTPPSNGRIFYAAPLLTYSPNPNYKGPDSFTFKAADAAGAESNVATVAVTVQAADAPAHSKTQIVTPASEDGHNDVVPFDPGTKEVRVYDVNGREVFSASGDGAATLVWTARDGSGRAVESGSYIARITDTTDTVRYQLLIVAK